MKNFTVQRSSRGLAAYLNETKKSSGRIHSFSSGHIFTILLLILLTIRCTPAQTQWQNAAAIDLSSVTALDPGLEFTEITSGENFRVLADGNETMEINFTDSSCISVVSDTTYCDSTGTFFYEFRIHNNSQTKYIEQLELTVDSPQPPNYVVTVPSTIDFPIPIPPLSTSGIQRVKLVGPGAVARSEVCYTLSVHFVHDDCPLCCYIENCIKLPDCGSCAEILQDSLYCSDDQYYYNFTLKNGTQYNVTKIQLTSPGLTPITFIPQTFHFGTPILPGQLLPNLTAGILGGTGGLVIPVKIKLFSNDFECCYIELLYTLPLCDTCDSAKICVKTLCPNDQITVCLANSVSPYNILFSATGISDINGCAYYNFPGAVPGASYYIVIKTMNSLETWSATPQIIRGENCLEYDFTEDSSRAYGNNMIKINGVWTLYSGDINQDGVIDLSDIILIYNNAAIFGNGITDLNCDGYTDLSDLIIAYNNMLNYAVIKKPL